MSDLSHCYYCDNFFFAVLQKHDNCFDWHVKNKSDVEAKNAIGNTALFQACEANSYPIVKKLLDIGANPDARNEYNGSPLMIAAFYCDEEIIRLLYSKGVDINVVSGFETTPLKQAISGNKKNNFILLISLGADYSSIKEKYGDIDPSSLFDIIQKEYRERLDSKTDEDHGKMAEHFRFMKDI